VIRSSFKGRNRDSKTGHPSSRKIPANWRRQLASPPLNMQPPRRLETGTARCLDRFSFARGGHRAYFVARNLTFAQAAAAV
jgi:hypothetical protein